MKIYTLLIALIATISLIAGFIIFRRPIPQEFKKEGVVNFSGFFIDLPVDSGYVDSLADGGSMLFIMSSQGGERKWNLLCEVGSGWDRYNKLFISERINGVPPMKSMVEVTIGKEELRNVLYYGMKNINFHNSEEESSMARNLYPRIFDKFINGWVSRL